MNTHELFLKALVQELTPLYPAASLHYRPAGRSAGGVPQVVLRDPLGLAVAQVQARPGGVYVGGQCAGLDGLLPWEDPRLVELIVAAIDWSVGKDPLTQLAIPTRGESGRAGA